MLTTNNLAGKDSEVRVGKAWDTEIVNEAIEKAGFKDQYAQLKAQFKNQAPSEAQLYSAASKITGEGGKSLDKVLTETGVLNEMFGRKPLSDTTVLNKLALALEGDYMKVSIVGRGRDLKIGN